MRWVQIILGLLLVLLGGTWTLQGLGYLEGSVMTGVALWAVIGPVVAAGGLWLVTRGVRGLLRH
ncbi:hypothetical protein Lfu02_39900 [Longispora fulva]|uniref:Vacuolar-type H+-ATPase subunit I/STV1 n=1 Tax=Longispora fulva TaxID=619741 RepID=A0A8J7GEV5_9ACTN|nr:hypothetical protein [Longispora fulva]MBG6136451.1 vacuolar-type H+-ATPase subunit I/STV1 [Longispora fulva]GIG59618.1 hypothetical protein Lfu02_39900 [Longispora fulva]